MIIIIRNVYVIVQQVTSGCRSSGIGESMLLSVPLCILNDSLFCSITLVLITAVSTEGTAAIGWIS